MSMTSASGGMADTPDLGSGAARLGGSSPPSRILGSIHMGRISNWYPETGGI
ncbi:unnamed protein product [marine sediment metagenome]|uniref:Uncharacterized protein n=1 Tax=marine sediment metagenome TaxID=412755 RepID=X0VGQ9_9ZZZZ